VNLLIEPDADSLHKMIVEGQSMLTALKEKLKPIIPQGVNGNVGRHFGIRGVLGLLLVSGL